MKFFRAIGKVAGFLFGIPSGGGSSPVQTAVSAVNKFVYTDEEKAQADSADVKDARSFAAPGKPLGFIGQVVDGANHAIRPWVTIELVRGLLGYRELPDISQIDPQFMTMIYIVLTFWFGGRTLLKDLPMAIAAIRQLRK